ncbi:hypothetical protein SAMN05216276_100360 [Streptosporangium subroseum]|uniref:Uncharacterized protein n=1 Tax=Streptosporangium subroseum TaxID=106412 RepID=A0A239B9S4_9ACTN|nr:hypothetical protein SAMN05216276_100360 [Streptosporangium subroseum]
MASLVHSQSVVRMVISSPSRSVNADHRAHGAMRWLSRAKIVQRSYACPSETLTPYFCQFGLIHELYAIYAF